MDCIRGRINPETYDVILSGIMDNRERFLNARRIIFVACGTSWHASLIGEYLIEDFCRIPVEVEYASEFRYRNPVIYPDDIVIAVSQSGETADTLAAIEPGQAERCVRLWHLQRDRLVDRPGYRFRHLHPRRA